jgi:DNA-3-methyladenine glycosylase II
MGKLNSGLRALIDRDADLARAFKAAGAPASRQRPPGFASLLRIIINQQVSVAAGRAIWRSLEGGLAALTPEAVLAVPEDGLRGVGLSRAKAVYARELAAAVADGRLDLDGLEKQDDAEVLAQLTRIKGIGRWTAEIYLMFALDRPDIWPAGDLALAVAVERLLGLAERPGPKELDSIAQGWRPWRSSAAVLLWHYYSHAGPLGSAQE